MAKIKTKGTSLKVDISGVQTALAQVVSLSKDNMQTETYDADTLDNADAGIPYEPTGRSEGGNLSGELFFDPGLAGHKYLTTLLDDPSSYFAGDTDLACTLGFASDPAVEWPFYAAGLALGVNVALNDGLKAPFEFKLKKLPTFPE